MEDRTQRDRLQSHTVTRAVANVLLCMAALEEKGYPFGSDSDEYRSALYDMFVEGGALDEMFDEVVDFALWAIKEQS